VLFYTAAAIAASMANIAQAVKLETTEVTTDFASNDFSQISIFDEPKKPATTE